MRRPKAISSFLRDVGAFLDARGLLPPRSAVVVGVSGGADSVALLDVLRRLAADPARRYRLTAAHLNHRLRRDARADADFVAELARRWRIPCVSGRREVAAEARSAGVGIEQAARTARYEFLTQGAVEVGATHVAVAHHADDNVETILYRIVRGTHLRGLAGIPASRRLGGSRITLIRPLLERTRAQIEAYCRAAGLSWRTDSTNADTAYRRNFIRHELLPLLRRRLNARADEAILRLGRAAAGAEEVLEGLARTAILGVRRQRRRFLSREADSKRRLCRGPQTRGPQPRFIAVGGPFIAFGDPSRTTQGRMLDVSSLAKEHPLVQTVAVRTVLEDLGVPMRSIDAARLEEIQRMLGGTAPAALALPGGWAVRAGKGRIEIVPPGRPPAASAEKAPSMPAADAVELRCPGRTRLPDGREVICRIGPLNAARFESHCRSHPPGVEWLDAGGVRGRLTCRPRRRGDWFTPLGGPGRQSVSDFLTNCKLPAAERESVLCICDDLGIVYLAPLRIDERARAKSGTRRVLRIRVRGGET